MKANEAPEKIYLSQERDKDGCYVDLMWHKHPYEDKENIQYIRTDIFIEKACEYLMEYEFNDSLTIADRRKRVDEFRKYMKEE